MRTPHAASDDHDEPEQYEIRLKGHLDDTWADRFDGLTITRTGNGETVLRGPVADQAALYGVLRKVRDLGLPLRSVVQVAPGRASGSAGDPETDQQCLNKEPNA